MTDHQHDLRLPCGRCCCGGYCYLSPSDCCTHPQWSHCFPRLPCYHADPDCWVVVVMTLQIAAIWSVVVVNSAVVGVVIAVVVISRAVVGVHSAGTDCKTVTSHGSDWNLAVLWWIYSRTPNGCYVHVGRAQLASYECLQVPLVVERDVTVDVCAYVYRW